MTGAEALKLYTQKSGMQIREICRKVNITESLYYYYAAGNSELSSMKMQTAYNLCKALNVKVDTFFDEIYAYKEKAEEDMSMLSSFGVREYHFSKLRKRYYSMAHSLKRTDPELSIQLQSAYKAAFKELIDIVEDDILTEEMYDRYIVPLEEITKSKKRDLENQDNVFYNAFLDKQYTYAALARYLNYDVKIVRTALKNESEIKRLNILKFLKLCYCLDISPDSYYL